MTLVDGRTAPEHGFMDERDLADLKMIHRLNTSGQYKHGCDQCGEEWPCSTIKLIAENEFLHAVGEETARRIAKINALAAKITIGS